MKRKKVTIIAIIITLISIVGVKHVVDGVDLFKDMEHHSETVQEAVDKVYKAGYMTSPSKGTFNPEGTITIEQALRVFARMVNEDEEKFKEIAIKEGVLRPSDMVYNKEMWEQNWREIIKGKKIFDKIDEETYSITIIPSYFRVHLNEQGYKIVKKGMIPQQISFYTPFLDIDSYTQEVMSSRATKGFVVELMTLYDIKQAHKEYTGKEQQQRTELMREITAIQLENTEGREAEWDKAVYDKYNFLGISYNGQMQYAKQRGILDEETTIAEMNKNITRLELALMLQNVIGKERDNIVTEIQEVLEKRNIDIIGGETK